MSRNRSRLETWATRGVLVVVAVVALIVGVPIYMTVTTSRLHPEPQQMPSVRAAEPLPRWAGAVNGAREIVRAGMADQNLPGLSSAVGAGDEIVWAEGFGWADLKARTTVTPATRFWIGTASTALTSAGVGVLLERNRLALDEEIQAYVPEFPKKRSPVTLRQLMAHEAGVGTDEGNDGPLFRQRCERPVDALRRFADSDLLFEPGTQQRHSKYGWILVSAAVEAAAQQPFVTFMREQIFEPLGMASTLAESAKEENPEDIGGPGEDPPPFTLVREVILEPLGITKPRPKAMPERATFYVPRSGADPRNGLSTMRVHNLSCYAGSTAFISTPSDLVRFALAMNGGTLLQPATVQQLQTIAGQQTAINGEVRGGMATSLVTLPAGITVAVASNVTHADTAALASTIAATFSAASAGGAN